jgi:hypothetical protein
MDLGAVPYYEIYHAYVTNRVFLPLVMRRG